MTAEIRLIRLSFSMIESHQGVPVEQLLESRLKFLLFPLQYQNEFAKAQKEESQYWTLPESGQFFWKYYLGRKIRAAPISCSYQNLLPVYFPSLNHYYIGRLDGYQISSYVEGFVYPHALAVQMHVFLKGKESLGARTLSDAVNTAIEVRQGNHFLSDSGNPMSIEEVLADEIQKLCTHWYGQEFSDADRSPIFSVVSVIKGRTEDFQIEPNSDTHKAIAGLLKWRENWDVDPNISALNELVISGKESAQGAQGGVYGAGNALVIWMPHNFENRVNAEKKLHTNNCYHSNLAMLVIQVQSLITIVAYALYYQDNQQPVPLNQQYIRSALKQLRNFYLGDDHTYKSYTAKFQIERYLQEINRANRIYGLPDIS